MLGLPVFVVPQKETVVPGVERRPHEQTRHPKMPHLAEAPIGCNYCSWHDAKPLALNLFAQHVVFGEKRAFVEPAQFFEF